MRRVIDISYDTSRCIASQCDIKEQCARYTSEGSENQSVADFSLGMSCQNFISNEEEEDNG